jgi:hypothetical protein
MARPSDQTGRLRWFSRRALTEAIFSRLNIDLSLLHELPERILAAALADDVLCFDRQARHWPMPPLPWRAAELFCRGGGERTHWLG